MYPLPIHTNVAIGVSNHEPSESAKCASISSANHSHAHVTLPKVTEGSTPGADILFDFPIKNMLFISPTHTNVVIGVLYHEPSESASCMTL